MISSPPKDPVLRVIALIACIVGTMFLLGGIGFLVRENAFGKDAVPATGTIVEVRETQNADGPVFTPVVEFETATGDRIRFSGLSTSPPPIKGKIVPVLYRPTLPRDARINTFVERWLFPSIFTPLGLLLLVGGGWYRITSRPRTDPDGFGIKTI